MMAAGANRKETCSLKRSLVSQKLGPISPGGIAKVVVSTVAGNMGYLSVVF